MLLLLLTVLIWKTREALLKSVNIYLPPVGTNFSWTNNIHEKISPFWLVKSSAVFFKQCRKESIQCKKRKQTKHSDWSMIKETHRWPIKSFAFNSSARPGWCNFSLIVWYAWVSSVINHLEIFSCILLISNNHMIFLEQFGINKHL